LEFPLVKEMVRLRGYTGYTLHLAAYLALLGWIIFSISIIINSFSLFFKTTDGIIVKIENRKIVYQYNLDGENIISDKTTLIDPILDGNTSNLRIGIKIAVHYSPFFKNKSGFLSYVGKAWKRDIQSVSDMSMKEADWAVRYLEQIK
jgi:hypothetical protein